MNPCQDSIMVKAFKSPRIKQKDILSRESVDEIIYRSKKIRDRLILELQARCGMRIGEVLNLRGNDITDRKLMIRQPKSGKDIEVAFMTESIAKRLSEYVRNCENSPESRIFPICYSSALSMVKRIRRKGERFSILGISVAITGQYFWGHFIFGQEIFRKKHQKSRQIYALPSG